MKFEVGKEYVDSSGRRAPCIAAGERLAILSISSGELCTSHSRLGVEMEWRPAPRTVERWIVAHDAGHSYVFDTRVDALKHQANCSPCVIAGPFKIEVPW